MNGSGLNHQFGVVAVDLGASGGRFAAGHYDDSNQIQWEIIEQITHHPKTWNDHEVWDIDALLGLCRRAAKYGSERFQYAAIGIDTWGVDHGFVDFNGNLLQPVVCYRDPSHTVQFEKFKDQRSWLFQETGIAHQPFNTVYQLAARKAENPELFHKGSWLLLPDLLGRLLGGMNFYELTQASTSQLMNLDCDWSDSIFEWLGIEKPGIEPSRPGWIGSPLPGFSNVYLAHVGSHDTASAVAGFTDPQDSDMFLNMGTWTLTGTLLPRPIVSKEAELNGFTNERAIDGKIRFLKNIAGFYVFNRILQEIGCDLEVGAWIDSASEWDERVDFNDLKFYNPPSMTDAVRESVKRVPETPQEWSSLAVSSFVQVVANQVPLISEITGKPIRRIMAGGGGARSDKLLEMIESASGLKTVKGPIEATVYGNLKVGLKAMNKFVAELAMNGRPVYI